MQPPENAPAAHQAPLQHLYIHVPFCVGHCSYCAFYKETFTPPDIRQWLAAWEQEILPSVQKYPFAIETIYMGGGTPSLLEPAQFQTLHQILKRHFNLDHCQEWTLEANPESVSETKLAVWQQAGITRISVGIQSMQPATLRKMQRRHDVATIHATMQALKRYPSFALGLDLIAGYPDVTDAQWEQTLQHVLPFQPDHLSVYECTVHPGTLLAKQISSGLVRAASPAKCTRSLQSATRVFAKAGYEHYEVSNYCQPGRRCQHNQAIWRGQDYLGLGPGAASRVGVKRWTNQPDIATYCQGAARQQFPREEEILSPLQDATERLMFAFRLRDPIDSTAYLPDHPQLSRKLLNYWQHQLRMLQQHGWVKGHGTIWQTTASGMQFVDAIAEALLPAPS